ncbi:MAG: GvpL/GvpF family gas vesicle protein [Deinococcota bacterium]
MTSSSGTAPANASNNSSEDSEQLYLYCLTEANNVDIEPLLADLVGIGESSPPRVISLNKVCAVVSDNPEDRYRVSRKNLKAHNAVIDVLRVNLATVPVRFGTLAPSEDALTQAVQTSVADIVNLFENVRGAAEYALRAEWLNKDALLAELGGTHPKLAPLKEALNARGASYHERINFGQKVNEVLLERREQLEDSLADLAANHAREVLILDLQDDQQEVANLALLMPESDYDAFMAELSQFDEAHPDLLRLRITGPLAAFSFADINLTWT